jgi:riboflavin kinase/FMN adenylyltransferase
MTENQGNNPQEMASSVGTAAKPMRCAAVVGMFDGVHRGHKFLLATLQAEAAKRGLCPVVFTFPRHPLEVVNPAIAPKLLSDATEKEALLRENGISNTVFLRFDEQMRHQTAAQFLRMLHEQYHVDFLLRGFNNRFGTERDLSGEDYRRIAAENGIELVEAPSCCVSTPNGETAVSSSLIRKALADGDVTLAREMLGYTYKLEGEVVAGKQVGRTIGFPTANVRPLCPEKLIPGNGVYICMAVVDGGKYKAMVNIGNRPTIDGANHHLTIEAYLLDFEGDIYGRRIELHFFALLRREQCFDSPEELAKQLASDRSDTENFTFLL